MFSLGQKKLFVMVNHSQRIVMTPSGYKKKQEELKHLVENVRLAKIAAVADAKALGDLSENAEYQEARREQSMVEGRIKYLESLVARAEVINTAGFSTELVKFGAFVTIENQDDDSVYRYQVVGDEEADIKSKKLSISSPIGRALLNKHVNDIVEVRLPTGQKLYKVLKIEY